MRGIILFLLCALCAAQTAQEVHTFDQLNSQITTLQSESSAVHQEEQGYSVSISQEGESLAALKNEVSKFTSDLASLNQNAEKLSDCCSKFSAQVASFHQQVSDLHVTSEDHLQALNEFECFLESLFRASGRNQVRMDFVNKQLNANTEQIIKLRQILQNLDNSVSITRQSVDENKISIEAFSKLIGEFSTTITATKKIVLINSQDIRVLSQEIQKNEFSIKTINENLKIVNEKVEWIKAHIGNQATSFTDIWKVITDIKNSVTKINEIYSKSSITIQNIESVINEIIIKIKTLFEITQKHKVDIVEVDRRWQQIDIDISELTKVVQKNAVTIVSIEKKIVDNNVTLVNLNNFIHQTMLVDIEKINNFFKEISDVQKTVNINVQRITEFHELLKKVDIDVINVNVTITNVFESLIQKIIQQQGSNQKFRESILDLWTFVNQTHERNIHILDTRITDIETAIEKIITRLSSSTSSVTENTVEIEKLRQTISSFESYIVNITRTYESITKEVNEVIEVSITRNTENITKLTERVEKLTVTINELEIHVIKDLSAICQKLNITREHIFELESSLKAKISNIWVNITSINNWISNHVQLELDLEKVLNDIKVQIKNVKETIKQFILDIEEEVSKKIIINSDEIQKISIDITSILTDISKIKAEFNQEITVVNNNIHINEVNIQNLDKYVRVKIVEDINKMYTNLESINVKVTANTRDVDILSKTVDSIHIKIDTWREEIDKVFNNIHNDINIWDTDFTNIETSVKQKFVDINVVIESLFKSVSTKKISITDISTKFKSFLSIVNDLTVQINLLDKHLVDVLEVKIKDNDVNIQKITSSITLINTQITDIQIYIKNTILVDINKISEVIVRIRNSVNINTKDIIKINTDIENNIKWIQEIQVSITNIREDIRKTNVWIHAQLRVLCQAVHINRKSILDLDNYLKINITQIIEQIDRKIVNITNLHHSYDSDVNQINIYINEVRELYNTLKVNIEQLEEDINTKISVQISNNTKTIHEVDEIYIDLESRFKVMYKYVYEQLKVLIEKIDVDIESIVKKVEVNTNKINDIRIQVHANSVEITDILDSVTNIWNSVNSLQANVELINKLREEYETQKDINLRNINEINTIISILSHNITQNEVNIQIINQAFSTIKKISDTSRSTLLSYIRDFESVLVSVKETEDNIKIINKQLYTITTEVNQNTVDITTIQQSLITIKEAVKVNQDSITRIFRSLVTIKADLDKNTVDIKALFADFTEIKKSVWDNFLSIKKINVDFTTIENKVSINIKNIEDLNTFISRVKSISDVTKTELIKIWSDIKEIKTSVRQNAIDYDRVHEIYLNNTREITLLQQLLHNQVIVLLHELQTFVHKTLLTDINTNENNTHLIVSEIDRLNLIIQNNINIIQRVNGNVSLYEKLWACLKSSVDNFQEGTAASLQSAVASIFDDPTIKQFLGR